MSFKFTFHTLYSSCMSNHNCAGFINRFSEEFHVWTCVQYINWSSSNSARKSAPTSLFSG